MRIQQYVAVSTEARQCRDFFEAHVNKLKNTPSYSSKNLECYCAVASWFLQTRISRYGIKSDLVVGKFKTHLGWDSDHCWVRIGNDIVDITLTQFGRYEKVYIAPHDGRFTPLYVGQKAYDRLRKWPEEQSAFVSNFKDEFESYMNEKFDKFRKETVDHTTA